jgi:hypothetical protein
VSGAITLRIPHQPPYHGVARLVVGGLAARLDVSFEQLEDLLLALASVLEDGRYVVDPEVTVELELGDDALTLRVGPVDSKRLSFDLDDESTDRIGLGRLLGTLVEDVSVESRSDGDWLRLEKRVRLVRPKGSHGTA